MLADFGLDCDVTGLNFANISFLEHLVLTKNNLIVRVALPVMHYVVFAEYTFVCLFLLRAMLRTFSKGYRMLHL